MISVTALSDYLVETADTAFALMRSQARSTRTRLVDVAQEVLAGLETRDQS